MIAYLDTSCAAALLKREEKSQEISDYLAEWSDDGHLLVAGELLATELNRVATRFGIDPEKAASEAWMRFTWRPRSGSASMPAFLTTQGW